VTYLIDIPVDGGGRLLVQAPDDAVRGDLEMAAVQPGAVIARVGQSLEQALDQIKPAVLAVRDRLASMAPDEVTVEFGLMLGAETGIVIAKGSSEVHFTVKLTWQHATRLSGGQPSEPAPAIGVAPVTGPSGATGPTGATG
jgi:hypothetical protein